MSPSAHSISTDGTYSLCSMSLGSSSSIDSCRDKKKVSFNPSVRAKKVKSIRSYTTEEVACTWYDTDELEQIQQEVLYLLHQERQQQREEQQGEGEDGSSEVITYCRHGLETQCPSYRQAVSQSRKTAFEAVIQEQRTQRLEAKAIGDDGSKDPALLASIYEEHSMSSQVKARMNGIKDEKIAHQIQAEYDICGFSSPRTNGRKAVGGETGIASMQLSVDSNNNTTDKEHAISYQHGVDEDECNVRATMLRERRRRRMRRIVANSAA